MTNHPQITPVRLTHADQILLEMAALVFIFGMVATFFRIATVQPPPPAIVPAAAIEVPAMGEAAPPEPAGHACETQATDIATLTVCLEAALGSEQAAMAAVYHDLTRLAPGAAPTLARSQETWLEYARADCDLQAQPFAGTAAQRVMSLNCEYVKTASRTRALAALAQELQQMGADAAGGRR
ncbi:MAG: lysozyme inhibitor LprI family protein [Pseudomonadota bacterium]